MDDIRLKAYFDASFVEYRAVRDEILATIAEYFRLLQFGSVALLGFMGVGFKFWGSEGFLVKTLFGLIMPSVAFICAEILIGQVARIHRASMFCQVVEAKLRNTIGSVDSEDGTAYPPISWDTWVAGTSASDDRRFTWIYSFGVEFCMVLSGFSVGLYEYYSFWESHCASFKACMPLKATVGALLIAPIAIELIKLGIVFRQAKQMAGPYRVPLFPPLPAVTERKMSKSTASITRVFRAGVKTVNWSGIIGAVTEATIGALAFGIGAGILLMAVSFCGTLVSSLPALLHTRSVEVDLQEKAPRTWRNALANGSVAAAISAFALVAPHASSRTLLAAMYVGSLAAAISDTVSHELGVLFGGAPRMITTLRHAKRGADGAISGFGTLSGAGISLALALMAVGLRLVNTRLALVAAVAGLVGNCVDSFLGATLQRRGWLGNHLVNFSCTLAGAFTVLLISRIFSLA